MQSRAYYNEHDPFAAQWLRNLIAKGLIADGEVDERSIALVQASDLEGFTQCHFFAGIGVWSHALRLAGWPDDRPVWTGSCPCQPFSAAGKGEGTDDARHLWPEWFRLIGEHRPIAIFGEQVASAIRHSWLDLVCADLEGLDYAVGAAVMGAHSVGAPHIRQRLYFVADLHGSRCRAGRTGEAGDEGDAARVEPSGLRATGNVGDAAFGGKRAYERESRSSLIGEIADRRSGISSVFWSDADWLPCIDGKARPAKSGIFPLVNGYPNRVGILRAAGNAIVPQAAAALIAAYLDYRGACVEHSQA